MGRARGEAQRPGQAHGLVGADRPLHGGAAQQAAHGAQAELGVDGHHHSPGHPDAVGGGQAVGTRGHEQGHTVTGGQPGGEQPAGDVAGVVGELAPGAGSAGAGEGDGGVVGVLDQRPR